MAQVKQTHFDELVDVLTDKKFRCRHSAPKASSQYAHSRPPFSATEDLVSAPGQGRLTIPRGDCKIISAIGGHD